MWLEEAGKQTSLVAQATSVVYVPVHQRACIIIIINIIIIVIVIIIKFFNKSCPTQLS